MTLVSGRFYSSVARSDLIRKINLGLNLLKAGTYKHERSIASPLRVKINIEDRARPVLNFYANNYLCLNNRPDVVKADQEAVMSHGTGLNSVRFFCGTQNIHRELAAKIAAFRGKEVHTILSDELNRLSITDDILLTNGNRLLYTHVDISNPGTTKSLLTNGTITKDLSYVEKLRPNVQLFRSLITSSGFTAIWNEEHSICSIMLRDANLPLSLPVHPKQNGISISDPARDTRVAGLVLDLPRFHTFTPLYDGPSANVGRLILPSVNPEAPELRAGGGRTMRQRDRHMKKHWRGKHFKRDIVIYRKRERRRKLAAEKVFRDRLSAMMKEAENFDAKAYVEEFLTGLKAVEGRQTTPSVLVKESKCAADKSTSESPKKAKVPNVHWTELISVEQLYGVPLSKFIDLNAGKVGDEEWQEILRLRERYERTFKKKASAEEGNVKQSDSA